MEFESKRAQARPKKSKPISSTAEIDEKLQELLLDIESESSTIRDASFTCTEVTFEDRIAGTNSDSMRPDPLFDAVSESDGDGKATMSCYPTGAAVAKNEIVDLVSPSPVQCRNVSKIRALKYQPTNAIELSDSETENSPEHERKARELRLFIASIKEDGIS